MRCCRAMATTVDEPDKRSGSAAALSRAALPAFRIDALRAAPDEATDSNVSGSARLLESASRFRRARSVRSSACVLIAHFRRSFSSALEITSSILGGISGFKRTAGTGSFSRIALKTTGAVVGAPRNGSCRSPSRRAPRRRRTGRFVHRARAPLACSGDM